ncbi:conserved hypothetical protein [Parvibaculum lavamentivorans DS-1]|uniref:Transmembrane protein n=2 Tax=Parvibaculum lavamentivorans TaxID=256618 RepID=A7HYA8_PARL1|nr:conserved hypothetical protein [Parvibaculum lavamentivorans DS-1]
MPPESQISSHDKAPDWRSRAYPIHEDMDVQRTTWWVQRCGWVALGLLVIAAALGLFSEGPLSTASTTGAAGRMEVSYDRFGRNGAATRISITVRDNDAQELAITLSKPMMDAFAVETVHPTPREERSTPEGTEFVFASTGGGPLRVYFDVRPELSGLIRSEISLPYGPPARLTQFTYP